MEAREFNFDGIVGPTHNYAGLSVGNIASLTHRQQTSRPRHAALQGLRKMLFVHHLGVGQAILPPLVRPNIRALRRLGFFGTDAQVIESTWRTSPELLASCYSASNMWTANAATVSPSADCADSRLHLTPANLASSFHRAIEAEETTRMLRSIFGDREHFAVHDPLPANMTYSDEGAANHTRLYAEATDSAIELFVYGRSAVDRSKARPAKFPARQTLEASQAVARIHQLDPGKVFFVQQNPEAIDAGVFHNDVIAVGNRNVLLYHEMAFADSSRFVKELRQAFASGYGQDLFALCVSSSDLSLSDAVSSYLFNSQLLSIGSDMVLVCPAECEENENAKRCIDALIDGNNPITQVEFMDLRQSMNNGGGPACLRLRVTLTHQESSAIHQGIFFSDELYERLCQWVTKHYRDELRGEDLRDPHLIDEVRTAIVELASILELSEHAFGL